MNEILGKDVDWDYGQDAAISEDVLNRVCKFHQSSCYILDANFKNIFSDSNMIDWAKKAQNRDIIPSFFENRVDFDIKKENNYSSMRCFDKKWLFPKSILGEVLYKSFGRSRDYRSKRYPSAGALYPVLPLLYVFHSKSIEDISIPGVYFIDSAGLSLLCIKKWSSKDSRLVVEAVNPMDKALTSNYAIGYAVDIRRSIAKYRLRGYRHALIEVGLMAQSFKESLKEVSNYRLGECCWSGFSDNSLTYLSGLNVRLAPVTMLQWFGKGVQVDT